MRIDNANQDEKIRALGEVLSGLLQQVDMTASASSDANPLSDFEAAQRPSGGGQSAATALPNLAVNTRGSSLTQIASNVAPVPSRNAASVLGSIVLSPIWRGLFSLFRSRGVQQLETPEPFFREEAESTQLDASWSPDGQVRELRRDSLGRTQSISRNQDGVHISIQALDARSILDRSGEIASAVRQAMLANHEINDSMTEL